ncbi:MAG: hypothetical protein WC203_04620 [Candidatus Bathyarchaeia archaeon]
MCEFVIYSTRGTFCSKSGTGLDKGRINYGSTDYSIIKENVLTYSKLH